MKVEDLSKLQIASSAGFEYVYARLGGHNLMVLCYPLIEEKPEGYKIVALIRAAPIMLEALKAARAAFEAIEYGVSDVIEKIDNAIEMAENTNERL